MFPATVKTSNLCLTLLRMLTRRELDRVLSIFINKSQWYHMRTYRSEHVSWRSIFLGKEFRTASFCIVIEHAAFYPGKNQYLSVRHAVPAAGQPLSMYLVGFMCGVFLFLIACFEITVNNFLKLFLALDPAKDPCLKMKCSRHKVCVAQDQQTAVCISHRRLTHR